MSDMLVKLYDFACDNQLIKQLEADGITVRRALAPEKAKIMQWVTDHFYESWASECDVAFSSAPPTCFIAVKDGALVGFACCEATCKNFFGPTGVQEDMRGLKLGKALLHISLQELKQRGYAYAIIGDAGPSDFYIKNCGAELIANSTPGIYKGMI